MFKRITLCFSVFVLFQEKHQLWKQGLRLFDFFTIILKIWNVLKGTIQNRTSWPFICPYPQVSRLTTSRAISSRTVSFEKKQPVGIYIHLHLTKNIILSFNFFILSHLDPKDPLCLIWKITIVINCLTVYRSIFSISYSLFQFH